MLKRESSNSISSSVVSESKVSHFSSGKENSDGNSPSDRVEKLLKKYKNRAAVQSSQSSTSSFHEGPASTRPSPSPVATLPRSHPSPSPLPRSLLNKQVLVELELWATINDKLQSGGLQPVEFVQDPSTNLNSSDYLNLSVSSSCTARQTISQLLRDIAKRNETIATLKRGLTHTLSSNSTSPIRPLSHDHVTDHTDAECGHMTELQSQVTRLEYETAKLRVELQNKPTPDELNVCQKKVQDLESELLQTRKFLSAKQVDLMQNEQDIKSICSLLSVYNKECLLPKLKNMNETLKTHSHLEKYFSSLIQLVYHHSAPKLISKWEEPIPSRPSGHDLWCEVTWNHVIMTLQQWSHHLHGLQELEGVIGEVCQSLELHPPPQEPSDQEMGEENEEVRDEMVEYSCGEMAALVRRWLLKKHNFKSVKPHLPLAMVRHFQHLFRIPKMQGVYPTMTVLSQQIELCKNVLKRLKEIFGLSPSCSPHQMVSTIEYIAHKENSQCLMEIHRKFGPLEINSILEKLTLCDEFFPAFHEMVLEIQHFLGVNSLSEITPALHKLQRT